MIWDKQTKVAVYATLMVIGFIWCAIGLTQVPFFSWPGLILAGIGVGGLDATIRPRFYQ